MVLRSWWATCSLIKRHPVCVCGMWRPPRLGIYRLRSCCRYPPAASRSSGRERSHGTSARATCRPFAAGWGGTPVHDTFDLVDGDGVGRPVVELRRLRRRVPRRSAARAGVCFRDDSRHLTAVTAHDDRRTVLHVVDIAVELRLPVPEGSPAALASRVPHSRLDSTRRAVRTVPSFLRHTALSVTRGDVAVELAREVPGTDHRGRGLLPAPAAGE